MEPSTYVQAVAPTLLILEERPFWSAEIQRQLGSEPLSIRFRSRARDAWEVLNCACVKMLVIGFDIEIPAVLRLLAGLMDFPKAPRVTVLLTPETSDLEWSLRELGAVDILITPFSTVALVEIVRREFDLADSRRLTANFSD